MLGSPCRRSQLEKVTSGGLHCGTPAPPHTTAIQPGHTGLKLHTCTPSLAPALTHTTALLQCLHLQRTYTCSSIAHHQSTAQLLNFTCTCTVHMHCPTSLFHSPPYTVNELAQLHLYNCSPSLHSAHPQPQQFGQTELKTSHLQLHLHTAPSHTTVWS